MKELMDTFNLGNKVKLSKWIEHKTNLMKIMGGKMNKDQRQQGDTIWRKIDSLPVGVKEIERVNGRIVVMHGEQGHTHAIDDIEAMFFEKDGMFYLKNDKPVTLTHEEHNHQVIEPGIWEIGQVQEKDWLSGMTRAVID